jgi:hypothetical protein
VKIGLKHNDSGRMDYHPVNVRVNQLLPVTVAALKMEQVPFSVPVYPG